MFEENGQWKEFGTTAPNHTAFPFWLFCIVWAIVSYLVTLLAVGGFRAVAGTAVTAAATAASLRETEPPEDMVMPLPPKSKGRNSAAVEEALENGGNMKPGYYVLDKKELRRSGIPKYIYIGEEPDDMITE